MVAAAVSFGRLQVGRRDVRWRRIGSGSDSRLCRRALMKMALLTTIASAGESRLCGASAGADATTIAASANSYQASEAKTSSLALAPDRRTNLAAVDCGRGFKVAHANLIQLYGHRRRT